MIVEEIYIKHINCTIVNSIIHLCFVVSRSQSKSKMRQGMCSYRHFSKLFGGNGNCSVFVWKFPEFSQDWELRNLPKSWFSVFLIPNSYFVWNKDDCGWHWLRWGSATGSSIDSHLINIAGGASCQKTLPVASCQSPCTLYIKYQRSSAPLADKWSTLPVDFWQKTVSQVLL